MISLEPLHVVAVLASLASVAATDLGQPAPNCYTIWADTPRNPVPTYYETIIHRQTSSCYSTSNPVVTVTSVDAPNTATITTTVTSTALTGDGTATVLAGAGFTPLADVIAAGGLHVAAHKNGVEAQATAAPEPTNINQLSHLAACRYHDNCYPAEINCIVHVRRVITSTQIIPGGQTLTSTVFPPGATATVTVTQTNAITAAADPTATAYQVCQANNVIDTYSATQPWVDAEFNGNIGLSDGTDGTDCCEKCVLMGANCQSSAFTDTALGGNCAYFLAADAALAVHAADAGHSAYAPTCVGTFAAGIAIYQNNAFGVLGTNQQAPGAISNYTFSNSNCGQLSTQPEDTTTG